jgi:hypothetical protein
VQAKKKPSKSRRVKGRREIAAAQAQARQRFGVIGSFVGLKATGGKYTRRVSLVCLVRKKKARDKIDRSARIPKRLQYRLANERSALTTDVIEARRGLVLQASFNPGDKVREPQLGVVATVGAYGVHHTFGDVLVTAGHFAQQVGGDQATVQLLDRSAGETIAGTIRAHQNRQGIDFCFIEPHVDVTLGDELTNTPIDAVYEPVLRRDLGAPLFVLARGQTIPTVCRGLGLEYALPDGSDTLTDLIACDPVTRIGDSGAALVDSDFRLWGFLIGSIPGLFSVFMPVTRLLALEPIQIGG